MGEIRTTPECDFAIVTRRPDAGGDLFVIDTKSRGAPRRADVDLGLALLRFLLARPVHVDVLQGCDDAGSPTSAQIGGGYGHRHDGHYWALWPIVDLGACWIRPAFEHLWALMKRDAPAARLAMSYFTESVMDAPDEAYLKLTVALEGLAMAVLGERGASSGVITVHEGDLWCVEDPVQWRALLDEILASEPYRAWRKYKKSIDQRIRGTARVAGGVDWRNSLSQTFDLRPDLGVLSAGQRVRAAFAALGLGFTDAMKRERDRWDQARHIGIAKRSGDADLEAQLALLRSMLVALLLRWAGYRGPFIGYETGARGEWLSADPAWSGDPQGTKDAESAMERFVASRSA